jgi:hypothetical protein
MNIPAFSAAMEPRELDFLQQFFNAACAERGLTGESMAAKNLAAEIIDLYQHGARDQSALQHRLDLSGLLKSQN